MKLTCVTATFNAIKSCNPDFFTVRNAADGTTYREATEKGSETTLDEAYARMV